MAKNWRWTAVDECSIALGLSRPKACCTPLGECESMMLATRPGRVGTAYGLAGYQAARGGYHRRWPAGSVALFLAGSELVGARPVEGYCRLTQSKTGRGEGPFSRYSHIRLCSSGRLFAASSTDFFSEAGSPKACRTITSQSIPGCEKITS